MLLGHSYGLRVFLVCEPRSQMGHYCYWAIRLGCQTIWAAEWIAGHTWLLDVDLYYLVVLDTLIWCTKSQGECDWSDYMSGWV